MCQQGSTVSEHSKTYQGSFLSGIAKQYFTFGRHERGIVSPIKDRFYIQKGRIFHATKKLRGRKMLAIDVVFDDRGK